MTVRTFDQKIAWWQGNAMAPPSKSDNHGHDPEQHRIQWKETAL